VDMKPFHSIGIGRLLMATFVILAICGIAIAASSSGYPRTIVDDAGRQVTIQMPVEKIVPLDSCGAKMIYLLGAQDKILAVGSDVISRSGYLPGVKERQSVGKWHEFDYEMIGELAKDGDGAAANTIVLCTVTGMDPVSEIAPALEGFSDITVIGLDTHKMENVTSDLERLGIVLEKENQVVENMAWYNQKIAQIEEAVAGRPAPRVYIEMGTSRGLGDLSTYGVTSSTNKLIKMANGYDVCREPKTFLKVAWEWVIDRNPEVILKTGSVDTLGWSRRPSQDATGLEKTRNEIFSRPGADTVSAVKSDRVYIIWNSMLSGFDNVVGAAYLAKIFHPEIDLDPDEISQEYMLRLGLDAQEDRVLVYPHPGISA